MTSIQPESIMSNSQTSVLVQTFPPFPSLTLNVPSLTPFSDIPDLLNSRYPDFPISHSSHFILSTHAGKIPAPTSTLSSLHQDSECASFSTHTLVTLRLTPRLLGGKGGFGSQLRAAGGRMSSQKTSNNDSCRDLTGRRLSTIKEAKKYAVLCCFNILSNLTSITFVGLPNTLSQSQNDLQQRLKHKRLNSKHLSASLALSLHPQSHPK